MFVIDRIENGIAIIEYNEKYIEVPVSLFKETISEGDVLNFTVDREETEKRRNDIGNRLNRLFNRKK